MGEQLTPADAALLSRVLGHEIEPGLVRTFGPSTLAAIIQAARSEGPCPESAEAHRLSELTLIKNGKRSATFERRPRQTDCYACFDMAAGSKYTCPNCGQGYSDEPLPEGQRPPRPNPIFPVKPQDPTP